jgi:hypothetical protein
MKRHHVLRPMSSFPSLTFELGERWRHVEKQNLGRVEGGTDASLRTVGGIFSDDASAELISSLSECLPLPSQSTY